MSMNENYYKLKNLHFYYNKKIFNLLLTFVFGSKANFLIKLDVRRTKSYTEIKNSCGRTVTHKFRQLFRYF